MDYNGISIKPYINHLELRREITLIEMATDPYFFVYRFVLHIPTCLQGLINPAMTVQDIKETKH